MENDRFIPFRKSDLVKLCIEDSQGNMDAASFEQVCQLLSAMTHYRYHERLELLKESYAPFDTNSDTRLVNECSEDELRAKQKEFANAFASVLDSANYEKITDDDLKDAMEETSLFNVRLAVEFDDFEEVVFYRRGQSEKEEILRQFWGLKKKPIRFTNFDRVAVYIKFKDAAYFSKKKKQPLGFTPGATIIKLFQNVPKADLEMLFPNSEVRMRKIDKLFIGASAVVGGAIVLVTKLGASIILLAALFSFWLGWREQSVEMTQEQLVALIIGLGVFASFGFKEWNKFKNRKIKFMKTLADNLYFKNLTNNAGVFHSLIDAAEEEDLKECFLAYYFLLKSDDALSESELDQMIEQWFSKQLNCNIDFEIDDALQKLVALKVVEVNDGQYTAKPLTQAKSLLDEQWDNYFDY